MSALPEWTDNVRRLHAALHDIRPLADALGVPPPEGTEWYEHLCRKLWPQINEEPVLVVAVVGGTNIGKSTIFNHLAGEEASRALPLAAGTRHPVCLVPPEWADAARLSHLFDGFCLRSWQSADDALETTDDDVLFWRAGKNSHPRLLLLDTPDIDSDAQVNWARADHIRQSADVLVGVLTDQKYRDAAVKRFFRAAVDADKPLVLVFNLVDLEQDAEWWPQWLAQFNAETGARPHLVYVTPRDRRAAQELRLPFHRIDPATGALLGDGGSLRQELASLHFDEIKLRTLQGALKEVLDPARGLPTYIAQIQAGSAAFRAAQDAICGAQAGHVDWPVVPSSMLMGEIRDWWDHRRSVWSRKIHGFYRELGSRLAMPARWLLGPSEPTVDPQQVFHTRERETIVRAVGQLLDELARLAEVGNDILRPRLAQLLGGSGRAELLAAVQRAHDQLPSIDADYRQFLRAELDRWSEGNPRIATTLKWLDNTAAAARPAISLALTFGGFWVVDHLAMNAVTEAAIGVGSYVAGEAAVGAAGQGAQHAVAGLFRRLELQYAIGRRQWLYDWLRNELLGDLMEELRRGGAVAEGPALDSLKLAIKALQRRTPE